MAIYLGDNQNGHFPPKCSINIAIHLSKDPKIALWIITGLSKPLFKGLIILYFFYSASKSSSPSIS